VASSFTSEHRKKGVFQRKVSGKIKTFLGGGLTPPFFNKEKINFKEVK
jgi:hypothetical protein